MKDVGRSGGRGAGHRRVLSSSKPRTAQSSVRCSPPRMAWAALMPPQAEAGGASGGAGGSGGAWGRARRDICGERTESWQQARGAARGRRVREGVFGASAQSGWEWEAVSSRLGISGVSLAYRVGAWVGSSEDGGCAQMGRVSRAVAWGSRGRSVGSGLGPRRWVRAGRCGHMPGARPGSRGCGLRCQELTREAWLLKCGVSELGAGI